MVSLLALFAYAECPCRILTRLACLLDRFRCWATPVPKACWTSKQRGQCRRGVYKTGRQ